MLIYLRASVKKVFGEAQAKASQLASLHQDTDLAVVVDLNADSPRKVIIVIYLRR